MVYRGKPSKACQRCRTRRLKCDLQPGICGQCSRAKSICSGYRDTETIRFQNETKSVATKIKKAATSEPRYLALSIETQARDAFFAYYVSSSGWEFLKPYYHTMDAPNPLTLAIEAVSLAYFWQIVHSELALSVSRQRYTLTLRMTNNMLRSPNEALKDTTLSTVLLLDVYEKFTDANLKKSESFSSHINGALALVKLRGLDKFQDPSQTQILTRLYYQSVATFVISGLQAADTLVTLRDYLDKNSTTPDHALHLSTTMIYYTRIIHDFKNRFMSRKEFIKASAALDLKLEKLELDMPPEYKYTTTFLQHNSERAFEQYYHSYTDRMICQIRNFVRIARINLNECLLDYYSSLAEDENNVVLARSAQQNIQKSVHEIFASLPYYTDCNNCARHLLANPPTAQPQHQDQQGRRSSIAALCNHQHTVYHQTDCHMLLLPLYAAGRTRISPKAREWVLKELHYLADHFRLPNAEVVAQILEGDEDMSPWDVYAVLSCYAFDD